MMGARFRASLRIVKQTISSIGDDELMTRAAALAFYAALSFAPLLVLSLWLVSSLDPSLQARVLGGLPDLVGERAAEAADLVVANASSRPGTGTVAGLISLGVSLFAASAVFAQLQGALNRVWNVQPQPKRAWLGWLRSRAQAIGMLLTLIVLLVISLTVSAVIAYYLRGDTLVWRLVEAGLSFVVFVAVFACVFKALPDAIIHWRDALIGAALTTGLFVVGKFVIGLYLDKSEVGSAYGPAAAVIVLLLWVFYSGLILLLGAELTHAVAAERGTPIQPRPHAVLRSAAEARSADDRQ